MRNSIKLNMDMGNLSIIQGSAKSISGSQDGDYISKINLIIPLPPGQISDGSYNVEYKEEKLEVIISTLITSGQDPLLKAGMQIQIGTPGTGLPSLPFQVFTDNRGIYPAVLATVIFPRRIATWVDDSHETGMKMNYDYEAMQVTGGAPDITEKILALVVINRLIESLEVAEKKKIQYDEVTVFSETYFNKMTRKPLIQKINALTSKHAYKNAVYDYFLPSLEKTEFDLSISTLHLQQAPHQITNEEDLKSTIEVTIEKILKHHIEDRRWIEPFWDGDRKVEHKGKKILVQRQPKSETNIQPTLHMIFDMVLSPLGIHVIRESDEGVGSLDFKFLYTTKVGTPLSVGVEFKLAHHNQVRKGISSQLPAYLRAIRSKSGIFVVMWFKDSKYFKSPSKYEKKSMEVWLTAEAIDASTINGFNISSRLLDASIRASASMI